MANVRKLDYVIVGAGSAGCVLANRLSEDPAVSVLILEAGGPDRHPFIKIPLMWGKLVQDRTVDWDYDSGPEPHTDNRMIECARGKVLGGSSSVNAMTCVRGNRGDYDRWAGTYNLPGWQYDNVLPYFKRAENWQGGTDEYRGQGGPMNVVHASFGDPLIDAYLQAGIGAGHPANPDYNGASQYGFSRAQQNTRNGRRESCATAYLHPALKRSNLTAETHAQANEILFNGNRAVGVTYVKEGKRYEAQAAREVILSGGVINSPHLLMLSGIGPAGHLKEHDINVRIDSPQVGQNLQDHIAAGVHYRRIGRGPFVEQMRLDRVLLDLPLAYFFGRGRATQFPLGHIAYFKLDPASEVPDIQLLFGAGPLDAYPWFPGFRKPFPNAFGCRAVLLHPKSRGEVRLTSNDPEKSPRIVQNFFSESEDMVKLRDALRRVREILGRPELEPYRGPELGPGEGVNSDDAIDAFVRRTCITVHHPSGTCRMGGDDESVVDGTLKVRGAENLRVVDAAVMPDLISGNINAAVIMIAEKAVDLIRGR
jgi:choline dehydrogenase/4-pyridoxate dehydrogenase